MKIAWLTDLHLEFVKTAEPFEELCRNVREPSPDLVLVGGDTAVAGSVADKLTELQSALNLPVYFVLGNHDYYYGWMAEVHEKVRSLSARSADLCWLSEAGVIPLTERTALIGHDSWADGRLGLKSQSTFRLNDYAMIRDFGEMNLAQRFAKLNALGDTAADYLRKTLSEALTRFDEVLLLTHVPPFREACIYEGAISSDNALPHFSCKAVGDMLVASMEQHPGKQLHVLCGHTHSPAEVRIRPNLLVEAGQAEYYTPKLQRIIEVS